MDVDKFLKGRPLLLRLDSFILQMRYFFWQRKFALDNPVERSQFSVTFHSHRRDLEDARTVRDIRVIGLVVIFQVKDYNGREGIVWFKI